jgi:alkanesulfonate monooxygenase SsuD/methylene tetrahydromethanopterin reductase-like flavin-dependent oxidoreductase (luciferase family)
MCRLAGEVCQGIHLHAFHTLRYLKEIVLPSVQTGLDKADRPRSAVRLTCPVFIVTGRTADEFQAAKHEAKTRIAFYGSTPSYLAVMELHGWGEVAARLSKLAREGEWAAMADQISDEMLAEFAVIAEPDEVFAALRERYNGVVDRICLGYDRKLSFTEIYFEHAAQL